MAEGLSDFEPIKLLLFVAPGATFAIFRSFAIRGFFPKLSKDDLGALVISSCVYALFIKLIGTDFTATGIMERRPTILWIAILFVLPMLLGFASGLIEARDLVGKILRNFGWRFPSPEPNAWETMFREMPGGSILVVWLDEENWVCGRWVKGSASSQSTDSRDLFLSEVGSLSEGVYRSIVPRTGVYFSTGEIKRIEVVVGQ